MDMTASLRIAHRVAITEAEGPGRRFALWVQGCSLDCPGCCNPELFDPAGGDAIPVVTLFAEVAAAAEEHDLEGLTIVGGEPLEQLEGVAALAAVARPRGLGVLLFTGYTWDEAAQRPGFSELSANVDTLVCGPFDPRLREPLSGGRAFIGSTNQELHHLSDRYAASALWRRPAAMELRISPTGEVEASGDPELQRRLLRVLPLPAPPRR
jgi:anaerobic ribonucleoside-triphosphate reductase activating protein